MKSYNVIITELRAKVVKVKSEDPKSAEKEARKRWGDAEPGFCLSGEDLTAAYFNVLGTDRLFRPDPEDPLDV